MYKNTFSQKNSDKSFAFDGIGENLSYQDDGVTKYNCLKSCYNYITSTGALKSGYGAQKLKMPTSNSESAEESEVSTRGNEILAIWPLKWLDTSSGETKYYLFYYNDLNEICYDNLLGTRLVTLLVNHEFTSVPTAIFYRQDDVDYLLFTGEDKAVLVGNGSETTLSSLPNMISCVNHYGKFFAITDDERRKLVYCEDSDLTNWSTDKTSSLDFTDERGELTKLICYEDYVYIFREHGITKLSIYGTNDNFAISHLYKSSSYIYPKTIARMGDKIYFLTSDGIKVFNGTSVSDVDHGKTNNLSPLQVDPCGETFKGKYFLAFHDENNSVSGNNALLIFDEKKKHIDLMDGFYIKDMLAFLTPKKQKLLAIFNDENKACIGEIDENIAYFGENLAQKAVFPQTDFGYPHLRKKMKKVFIRSKSDCSLIFQSEKGSKEINFSGSESIQKKSVNLSGLNFSLSISSSGQDVDIGSISVEVEVIS